MDFEMESNGSIYLIRPLTAAAKDHAAKVYADALTFGGAVAVEHGYAEQNAAMLLADGFTVSLDGRELKLA